MRGREAFDKIVEFKSTDHTDLAPIIPTLRRIGGTRIEFDAPDFEQAFRTFYALVNISSLE